MVSIGYIKKSFDMAIVKCKTSSSARKRGKGAVITKNELKYIDTIDESDCDEDFLNELFEVFDVTDWDELSEIIHDRWYDYDEVEQMALDYGWDSYDLWFIIGGISYISNIKYHDGTEIKFNILNKGDAILDSLTIDGVVYKYSGDNASDNFKYQEKGLSDSELKHRYEVYKQWISDIGFTANEELREGKEVSCIKGYDEFNEWINNSKCDYDNIVLGHGQRELYESDAIEKHIVKTKGHFCTSVGMDNEEYTTFNGRTGWMVYEVVGKGSGVRGLFLSNAVKDFDLAEREKEVILPVNQKRERLLIDEVNKIIIEKPIV